MVVDWRGCGSVVGLVIWVQWVKILAGRGFARRGSVVLVVCSLWVSRGFASRGSIVGLLAVGQSWVCSPWISGARRLLAVGQSWVCSPWVCRGFARRGSVVGLLAGFARRGFGFCLLWVCSPSPLAPTPLALLFVLSMKFMEF
nr:hypothetical protein CFP56_39535 [Quercus suber]